MRRLTSLLLLLPLLGGGCTPRAPEAAVRLEVSYTFKAGCIKVLARDDQGHEASDQIDVSGKEGPSPAVLAVFRQESWGHTLELITTAHEQSCEGPEVAQDKRSVTLQKKGDIARLAFTLEVQDADDDGYMSQASGGTDCDDGAADKRPGLSESCDGRDNDCDGELDEGLPTTSWYPDRDGDGFGDRDATALKSCAKPADSGTTRYVQDATDCGDSDPQVYPRAGISEALCDEVDNDCDGEKDDGFAKGTSCSNPCPGGKNVCNANHDGLTCIDSPPQIAYYPDLDGDDAGDEHGIPTHLCPGVTPPAGYIANTNDCDDQDKHNLRGKAEVCDDRDNNCDSQRDEGNICSGKGWNVVNDPALIGTRNWKTVALGSNGRVWLAGDDGRLAVRLSAGEAFKSLDGSCGNVNWRAAWVRPDDNHVFLAGEGGKLAEHDGTTCSNQETTNPNSDIQGIIGFSSTLYVVNTFGRLFTWTPGAAAHQRYDLYPATHFGIHGLASTQLLTVGGTEGIISAPSISSYPGTGNENAVTNHTLNGVPNGYTGALRAVWMASSSIAYAVGDAGLVEKWNGATSWTRVDPPSDSPTAGFSSVVAPDPFTIYVTDINASGSIRRLSARGVWSTAYTTNNPLRDIAIGSPTDIWAVGDNGTVVHFPQ